MASVKTSPIFFHLIGWIIFLCLPLLFLSGQNSDTSVMHIIASPFYWLFVGCYGVLFYSHTYYIFPTLYQQKKYIFYFLYLFTFLLVMIFMQPFDLLIKSVRIHESGPPGPPFGDHRFPGPPNGMRRFDIIGVTLYLLTLILSAAIVILNQLRVTKEMALETQQKKTEAELSFLKSQINPHFLFNTLNNIYSLAESKHDNTGAAILTLSSILRYVTEEVSALFVPLDKEIACINDYLSLQSLRLSKVMNVDFSTDGNTSGYYIAPMLLMTFIENAFKYGVSTSEMSFIRIHLRAEDHVIHFSCQNKIVSVGTDESTGIGLKNTRQRLDLLYPAKYSLEAKNENNVFTVQLTIQSGPHGA